MIYFEMKIGEPQEVKIMRAKDEGKVNKNVTNTMEYYSAIKRNEIPAFLATWMDLEIIMLSEVSHTMRHQHQMLSLTCGI